MIRDDDVKETLDRASSEIAEIQSNPRAWLIWLIYLLDRLESQAITAGSAHAGFAPASAWSPPSTTDLAIPPESMAATNSAGV